MAVMARVSLAAMFWILLLKISMMIEKKIYKTAYHIVGERWGTLSGEKIKCKVTY